MDINIWNGLKNGVRKVNKPKFVIVSNRPGFGGPIVLYKLCSLLSDAGYDAKIFPCELYYEKHMDKNWKTKLWYWARLFLLYNHMYFIRKMIVKLFPKGNYRGRAYKGIVYEPVKGCNYKLFPFIKDDTIVVYPEVIYGNPLHAKNVVRLLLYKTDMYDDPKSFGENDLFFCYREMFNDYKRNPSARQLKVFHFDLDLYKQTNYGKRQGSCYIVRKGKDRKDLPESFDGPVIDEMTEPEIVKIFNTCEKAYLYDLQTSYASIAALCGCIPISVLEPGKTKEDYIGVDDAEPLGRAFADTQEEINYAIKTREALKERFEKRETENMKEVNYFLKECELHFKIK